MTLYALLRQLCGLSQREAAEFHGVSLRSIEGWCAGPDSRRDHEAPAGVIAELRTLYARIEAVAAASVAEIRSQNHEVVTLRLTDKEAKAVGLPCVGAHAAMLAIVAARLNGPVMILPRGSTPATRATVRAHDLVGVRRNRKQ